MGRLQDIRVHDLHFLRDLKAQFLRVSRIRIHREDTKTARGPDQIRRFLVFFSSSCRCGYPAFIHVTSYSPCDSGNTCSPAACPLQPIRGRPPPYIAKDAGPFAPASVRFAKAAGDDAKAMAALASGIGPFTKRNFRFTKRTLPFAKAKTAFAKAAEDFAKAAGRFVGFSAPAA